MGSSRIFHSIKTHFDFVQNNDFFSHHIYRLFSFFSSYLFALFFRSEESNKLDEFEDLWYEEEDDHHVVDEHSFTSSSKRYEFVCGNGLCRFMEEPAILRLTTIHDSVLVSGSDFFSDAIMDTPVFDTGEEEEEEEEEEGKHKVGSDTEQPVTSAFEIENNIDASDDDDDEVAALTQQQSRSTIGDFDKISTDTNEDSTVSDDDGIVVAAADEVDLMQKNLESSLLIVESRNTIGGFDRISTNEDNSASSDDGIVVAAADEAALKQQNLESSLLIVESRFTIWDFDKFSINEDNTVSDGEFETEKTTDCINEILDNEEYETEETEDSIDEVSEKPESEIDDNSSECSNDVFEEQIDSNSNIISVPEGCLMSLEQSNNRKGEDNRQMEGTTESSDDDEYIELLPQKLNSILLGDETFQPDKRTSSQGVSENDEHEDLIQQLKMDIKLARTGGLPTIIEEPELQDLDTPKAVVQHLKPMKIDDQKLDYKHILESVRKVYKNYSDKMRKLDILNFQTMHSLGLVDIKDRVELQKAQKSLVPGIMSLVSHNLWLCKGSAVIEPIKKVIVDMQTHFETVYIGQLCLSWEILHWQYSKAQELQNYQSNHSFNQVAGEFQFFQVLIQRFLENEQFQGARIQNYVNNRCVLRALLQVPLLRDDTASKDKVGKRGNESNEGAITRRMLPSIIEQSMKVFWDFIRADKGESTTIFQSRMHSHSNPEQFVDSELLADVRIDFQKKEKMLKDILRSGNCIVKRFKKQRDEDYGMHQKILIAQVEMKLVAKVLSMPKLTTEKLIWCHEKLDKINVSNRKVFVEPSFLLFPC